MLPRKSTNLIRSGAMISSNTRIFSSVDLIRGFSSNHTQKSNKNKKSEVHPTNKVHSPLKIIEQNYEGWRLTFGANPMRLFPGINWRIPFVQQMYVICMKEDNLPLQHLNFNTEDNINVNVDAIMFFKVTDSYKAQFDVVDYKSALMNTGRSLIRDVCGKYSYEVINGDRPKINQELKVQIGTNLHKWGIECLRFEIQEILPTSDSVLKNMEIQSEEERKKRGTILDTEGRKNQIIGLAEAEADATIRRANAKKEASIREAEANKESLIKEADGEFYARVKLAHGVEILSEKIGSTESAIDFLLQMKKIEGLNQISSTGNNVYFLPNSKDLMPQMMSMSDQLMKKLSKINEVKVQDTNKD
jgi:regulator of protease activity HflC (stomatin/prohibitin superfamily)